MSSYVQQAMDHIWSQGVLFIMMVLGVLVIAPTLTWATLPANELWREDLLDELVGFGKDTTGGAGGTLCTVTNLNNSGAGSLRACAATGGAQWIVFSVSGTINLSSVVIVGSDKTIDGRGQNVVIQGFGLRMEEVSNVIIVNVTMEDTADDSIQIRCGGANFWIDHVTFGESGDEQLFIGSNGDVCPNPPGEGILGVTISWNRFNPTTGSGSFLIATETTSQDMDTTVTSHHNYHNLSEGRNPYEMQARMHSFNNFYYKNEIATQVQVNGRYYSENDVFENPYGGAYPRVKVIDDYGTVLNVKVTGQYSVTGGETYEQRNAGTIFTPSSFYAYTPETANAALRTAIISGAGWQDVSPPSDTTPPSAPTNLSATPISSARIDLTWTASTDAVGVTGYTVFRGGVEIDTTATTSYSDTGLSPSTAYSYTITAFDAASNISDASSADEATTLAGSGNVVLTWTEPTASGTLAFTSVYWCLGATCTNWKTGSEFRKTSDNGNGGDTKTLTFRLPLSIPDLPVVLRVKVTATTTSDNETAGVIATHTFTE